MCQSHKKLHKILAEEDKEKGKSEPQQSYKVYNFFKKNPGLLAGVGSLLVVVISAIINFCSYAYDSAILSYWNVDPVYMDISLPSRIHGTVVSITFVIVFFCCLFILDMLGKKEASVENYLIYLKQIRKQNRKEFRKIKRKEIIAKVHRRGDYNLERNRAINRKEIIRSRKIELGKVCAVSRRERIKTQGWLGFLLAVSVYVWISLGNASFSDNFLQMQIALIVASMLMSAILILIFTFTSKRSFLRKKQQRECAKNDYENGIIERISSLDNRAQAVFDSGEINFRFSDKEFFRGLHRLFRIAGALIIVVTLIFQWLGYYTALQKHSFMVISEKDKEYVVIYNNGETAIVAQYEEDEHIVDTGKQKVIAVENLEFVIRECGKVEKGTIDDLEDGQN